MSDSAVFESGVISGATLLQTVAVGTCNGVPVITSYSNIGHAAEWLGCGSDGC
jgi:hypothetical protein